MPRGSLDNQQDPSFFDGFSLKLFAITDIKDEEKRKNLDIFILCFRHRLTINYNWLSTEIH